MTVNARGVGLAGTGGENFAVTMWAAVFSITTISSAVLPVLFPDQVTHFDTSSAAGNFTRWGGGWLWHRCEATQKEVLPLPSGFGVGSPRGRGTPPAYSAMCVA